MTQTYLLLSSSADETGGTFVFTSSKQQFIGQITVTGTQTVDLQGRVDENHDWVSINQVTASAVFYFSVPGQLRVVTSGTAGGSSVTSVTF